MNGIKTKHLIIGILILVIGYYWAVAAYADYQNEKAYKEAIDLIAQGEYTTAVSQLIHIDNGHYKDTDALIQLCWAHREYDNKKYEQAYIYIKDYDEWSYKSLPSKEMERLKIKSFYQEVKDAYKHWYENGGKRLIEIREEQRIDKELKEQQKRKEEKDKEKTESSGSNNNYYRGNTYHSYQYSDPYDVYDYDDPEDFYYDNEDDFDGYEDAEDYWENTRNK